MRRDSLRQTHYIGWNGSNAVSAIVSIPSPPLTAETPGEKTMTIELTEPARRHRCDVCKDVFECHLCTISADHILHWNYHRTDPEEKRLICEECSAEGAIIFIRHQLEQRIVRYSALTGERL
jgi:hypothetical protein